VDFIGHLTKFLWKNCPYLHEKNTYGDLRRAVESHVRYNTIVYAADDKGLTGVCRFNIFDGGAYILDVAVRKDLRGGNIFKELLETGLRFFPDVKVLKFNSIKKKREFTIPVGLILAKEK